MANTAVFLPKADFQIPKDAVFVLKGSLPVVAGVPSALGLLELDEVGISDFAGDVLQPPPGAFRHDKDL